jgi:hypothetical protein
LYVRSPFILKKEPKSASRRLNKLKKRVLKSFLDEILNHRSAGPLSFPVPATGTETETKRKILAALEPGPKKKLPGPGPGPNKKSYRDLDQDRDQKKLVPHISIHHIHHLILNFQLNDKDHYVRLRLNVHLLIQ